MVLSNIHANCMELCTCVGIWTLGPMLHQHLLHFISTFLLHKMREWSNFSLSMYIDDGAIFAYAHSWKVVEKALQDNYAICVEWIMQVGLNVKPEKTELIFFKNWKKTVSPPLYIYLSLPAQQMYYWVPAALMLWYLGFFFDINLNWTHHVEVMCIRSRASIKLLWLLGNLV